MQAIRVHQFGGLDSLVIEDLPRPTPTTSVGDVLPLAAARIAHEMLAGRPHKRGKIVLAVDGSR